MILNINKKKDLPVIATYSILGDLAQNVGGDATAQTTLVGPGNKVMQQIADEAGVPLGLPLYSDALGEAGSEGDTYIRFPLA